MTQQNKTTAATLAVVGCIIYMLLSGCTSASTSASTADPAVEPAPTSTVAVGTVGTDSDASNGSDEPSAQPGDVGDTQQVDGFTVAVAGTDMADLRTITFHVNVRNETEQALHVTENMWTMTGPGGLIAVNADPEHTLLQPGQAVNGTVTAVRGGWDIPDELWGIPGSARRDDPEHVALYEAVAATDGTYYLYFEAGDQTAVWAVHITTSVA